MTPEEIAVADLEGLEGRWLELDVLAAADEEAVLSCNLTKEEYIARDRERYAERRALEVRAAQLRQE